MYNLKTHDELTQVVETRLKNITRYRDLLHLRNSLDHLVKKLDIIISEEY